MWKIQNHEKGRMLGNYKEYLSFGQMVLAFLKY